MQIVEEFLEKHQISDRVIAAGVSGGADSLALVLQAAEELAVFGRRIVALTVNHGLRPSAAQEAEYVGEIMRRYKIEHHVLEWKGQKPATGVEEAARLARYALLGGWCKEKGVHVLLTAHHLRDQAETFLMRLQRGSGLEGLCCMREKSERDGLIILRPFLHTNPEEMREYLREKNIRWIEDEANEDEKYLRNRIRKFLPELEAAIGITAEKIDTAVTNLQCAESFLERQTAAVLARDVREERGGVKSFAYSAYLSWEPEIRFRILACLCRRLYIPRADRILRLEKALVKLPFGGATLGGREFLPYDGRIWIVPEAKDDGKESRKSWKELEQRFPEYKGKKFPHKVRTAILRSLKDDGV